MQIAAGNWQLWALMSAAFAAMTAILAKVGVERVDPTFATFIRTLVIVGVAGVFVLYTQSAQPLSSISARSYSFLILSGVATGLSWLCYFHALKVGPVAAVASIDKLSVVMIAVFAVVFLGETMTVRQWIAVGMIGGGALLLASR